MSSLEVGLCFGSLTKQAARKSLKSLENFCGSFKVGGGFLAMRSITLIGGASEYGGSPCANSIKVAPSDQTSAFASYPGPSSLKISGAM